MIMVQPLNIQRKVKTSKTDCALFLFKLNNITLALLFLIPFMTYGQETVPEKSDAAYDFDPSLLRQTSQTKIDLSRFATGVNVQPGKYRVDVVINGQQAANQDVTFSQDKEGTGSVSACVSPDLIKLIPLDMEKLPPDARSQLGHPSACTDLPSVLTDSSVKFDTYHQQLNINVPQLYIRHVARGYVAPENWDGGIPAFILGYYVNGYESHTSGTSTTRSFYSSLNAGFNLGKWYFRHNGSYNWQKDAGGSYQSSNTYVERDTEFVHGHLYLGQYYTSGQLFDTVQFTGAEIATDDRMMPESQRGYAPEIRGVAKTNAKVTIRQSGQIIYETTVTPGAFLINDLDPTGYGGDLNVTVLEADGSEQKYTVPYASLAQSLRPGAHKFSLAAGKLRDNTISDKPLFTEITFMRGLNNILTGYTGAQVSEHYRAVQVGTAIGTAIGAVSFDATQSWSQIGGSTGNPQGQSYRFSYSKDILATDSNVTLAAYRYSSSGYMDLQTAAETRDAVHHGEEGDTIWRSKNQFSVTLNQGLPPSWGNIFLSASMQNYWNEQGGYNTQYQAGYSNSYKWLSYSINVSRNKTGSGQDQTSWYLNLSMPLWTGSPSATPYLSMRYNQDNSGGKGEQASLSGFFGDDSQYGYNMSASHDAYSGSSGNFGGNWQNRLTSMDASYSTGKGYHSASLGMKGGLVVHSDGITFSPYSSDNYALVEAKGAEGAKITGHPGVTIDSSGYALFPSLSPYQLNDVSVDPEGSSFGVEFDKTTERIAPRAGAISKVTFNTHSGTPLLIHSEWHGEPLPFGADVFDDNNEHVGNVAQGGMIYANVSEERGRLTVKWGDDEHSECMMDYYLKPAPDKKNIQQFEIQCR